MAQEPRLRHTQAMKDRRPTSRAARRRRSWTIFGVVSTLALAAAVVETLRTSTATQAGLVLMGGLIVVGIGAALMHAIVSPYPEATRGRYMGAGFYGGDGGGGFDGGGGGGGGD
ncbi:hypothetical protein GCM10023339_71560 [Alloalcanivorax gelatiniphagus]